MDDPRKKHTVNIRKEQRTSEPPCCPECGKVMVLEVQCMESDAIYTWYKCGKEDCDGAWLGNVPKTSPDYKRRLRFPA